MSELPEYVIDLLSEIAHTAGLSDYTFELSAGSNVGDNYMGIIHRVILRGQRNHAPTELPLIIKISSSNEIRCKEFQFNKLFEREALVYNKILPFFEKFQRDRGLIDDEAFTSFPKCYAAVADEQKQQFVVIMEDLKAKGFEMLPKEMPIERDTIFMIVGQLARMHAISLALKDQQPEVYEEFRKLRDIFRGFLSSDSLKHIRLASCDRAIAVVENAQHVEWLKELKANFFVLIAQLLTDNAADPFGVIGHGDLWMSNMLFHRDNKKSVDGVCFLDWQLARFASPVLDLYDIIFTATDKPLRDKEYKNLLDCYHQTFTKTIKILGSDPEIFTRRHFDEHLKKFAPWAIINSVVMTIITFAEAKDVADMDDVSTRLSNDENASWVKEFDEATKLRYTKRMQDHVADIYGLVNSN